MATAYTMKTVVDKGGAGAGAAACSRHGGVHCDCYLILEHILARSWRRSTRPPNVAGEYVERPQLDM